MLNIRKFLGAVSLGLVLAPSVVLGASLASTTTDAIDTVVSDMVQDTLDLFTDNIGTIFTVAAAIIGIGLLYKFIRRIAR